MYIEVVSWFDLFGIIGSKPVLSILNGYESKAEL